MMKRLFICSIVVVFVLVADMAAATGMIEALARKIVTRHDTNDEKMFKIEQWVQKNITYVSDIKLYGREDASYFPAVTIRKGKADCEDGAFLTQSLAAFAGIPLNRVKTLFGKFMSRDGIKGHAWTVYKRETDNQWVVADWTDKRAKPRMSHRAPISRNKIYMRIKVFAYTIITKMRPLRAKFVRIKYQ